MFCPSPLARAESSNCLLPMYTEYGDAPTSSWLDELLPETQMLSPCAELLPATLLLSPNTGDPPFANDAAGPEAGQALLVADADADAAGPAAPAASEWCGDLGEWSHTKTVSTPIARRTPPAG